MAGIDETLLVVGIPVAQVRFIIGEKVGEGVGLVPYPLGRSQDRVTSVVVNFHLDYQITKRTATSDLLDMYVPARMTTLMKGSAPRPKSTITSSPGTIAKSYESGSRLDLHELDMCLSYEIQ